MRKKLEHIKKAFGGKLIGNPRMQVLVCEALLLFPAEVIDFVTTRCWFVSSFDDAWGFTLTGEDIQGKYLIFLSDGLLDQNNSQKYYTIAHEIGHVMLKHQNAILEQQSLSQTQKQEEEADLFAKLYLQKLEKNFSRYEKRKVRKKV